MINLSIITTFHKEGNIACQTIGSIARCVADAEKSGVECEWLAVADRTDRVTLGIVQRGIQAMPCAARIIEVDVGDPGMGRNIGVDAASGQIVAITDGDDYFSRQWLTKAAERCEQRPDAVVTPQYILSFGSEDSFYEQISSEDEQFSEGMLLTANPWSICVMARRDLFRGIPYRRKSDTAFLYEDWQWSCETIAKGHPRITVPETAVFYRRRDDGVLATEKAKRGTFGPTSLFARKIK